MKLKITVDGKSYEVDVEVSEDDRAPAGQGYASYYAPRSNAPAPVAPAPAAAPPVLSGGAPVADEQKVCRSPLAGVVVRINAQVGQQIQPNDPLLVLEAMKMETNVTAPAAGKIKAINAALGDAVQVGQVLVEFE